MSQEQKHSNMRLLVLMALLASLSVLWWSYMPPVVSVTEQPESGEPAQQATTKSYPTKTTSGAYIVRYGNDGFSPFIIELRRGETIQFQNESGRALWVTTKDHPTAKQQNLDELDFERSLASGEVYEYTANKVGVWGYYNLNNRAHLGTLVVIE